MSNKKVLVTGGAGFVGSHLCERLIKMGCYDVYSLDNYFTGSELNHIDGVTYIRGDTKDISTQGKRMNII
ncbi:NAD-dependent epimerase/dehydratase family protein [Marinomonas sp.]|uniref:NAD-dependent epimerase/dehydratase family protein n=1 Tax=Marinomonas sp. TaxID=1904862 RepID=UPI003BAA1D2A